MIVGYLYIAKIP